MAKSVTNLHGEWAPRAAAATPEPLTMGPTSESGCWLVWSMAHRQVSTATSHPQPSSTGPPCSSSRTRHTNQPLLNQLTDLVGVTDRDQLEQAVRIGYERGKRSLQGYNPNG